MAINRDPMSTQNQGTRFDNIPRDILIASKHNLIDKPRYEIGLSSLDGFTNKKVRAGVANYAVSVNEVIQQAINNGTIVINAENMEGCCPIIEADNDGNVISITIEGNNYTFDNCPNCIDSVVTDDDDNIVSITINGDTYTIEQCCPINTDITPTDPTDPNDPLLDCSLYSNNTILTSGDYVWIVTVDSNGDCITINLREPSCCPMQPQLLPDTCFVDPNNPTQTEMDACLGAIDCTQLSLGTYITQGGTAINPNYAWTIQPDGAGGCTIIEIESPIGASLFYDDTSTTDTLPDVTIYETYFNPVTGNTYYSDGTNWTLSPNCCPNPSTELDTTGCTFVDVDNPTEAELLACLVSVDCSTLPTGTKIWTGGTQENPDYIWEVGNDGTACYWMEIESPASGGTNVTTDSTAPTNSNEGDIWINNSTAPVVINIYDENGNYIPIPDIVGNQSLNNDEWITITGANQIEYAESMPVGSTTSSPTGIQLKENKLSDFGGFFERHINGYTEWHNPLLGTTGLPYARIFTDTDAYFAGLRVGKKYANTGTMRQHKLLGAVNWSNGFDAPSPTTFAVGEKIHVRISNQRHNAKIRFSGLNLNGGEYEFVISYYSRGAGGAILGKTIRDVGTTPSTANLYIGTDNYLWMEMTPASGSDSNFFDFNIDLEIGSYGMPTNGQFKTGEFLVVRDVANQ